MKRSAAVLVALVAVVVRLAYADTPALSGTALRAPIVAQDLNTALTAWAEQSGIQVIYATQLAAGLKSPGAAAGLPPGAALEHLLGGTGLEYRVLNDRTVSILPVGGKASLPAPRDSSTSAPGTDIQGVAALRDEPPAALTSKAAPAGLEEVVVVGTLLPNTAPTSPVITLDRTDIDRTGSTSVQDVMSKLPQNFSGQTAATTLVAGGNAGFTNQVDIRGLGSQSTLTLVDGHRVSAAAGDAGRAVDINMIPLSAIERIDILTDGASALYGSDAIGGVVNIMLRKNFTGAQTTLQYGSDKVGGMDTLLSQAFGASWDGGRFLGTLQYGHNDSITSQRLGYNTTDYRARGGGDFRSPGYGSPGTVYPAGYYQGMPFQSLTGPAGAPIYFAALPPNQNGQNLQLGELTPNVMTTWDGVPLERTPTQQNLSTYLDFEQVLSSVTLFGNFAGSRRSSRISFYPPVQILYVPAGNAFSPFREDVMVGYVMNEFGPLRDADTSQGWFSNLGLRGKLGGDWSWEVTGSVSADRSDDRSIEVNNDVLTSELAASDPAHAFNPFGDGTGQYPGVVAALRQQNDTQGRTGLQGISGLFRGSVAELPGGRLRLAAGAEFRHESMSSIYLFEGQPNDNAFPSTARRIGAVYGEAYLPLVSRANARKGIEELALSVAARHEHYSDFGSTTNPKVGAVWKPTQALSLRANWGTSFRAPSLSQLSLESMQEAEFPVLDPHAPGGPKQAFITLFSGGNPHLRPEKATSWTASTSYQPSWLHGLQVSADYFHIYYRDRILGVIDGLSYTTLLQYEATLPGGVVVRDASGNLLSINNININAATNDISGWDVAVAYNWAVAANYFGLQLAGTDFDGYKRQLVPGAPFQSLVGHIGNPPRWRAHLNFNWSRGPWAASLAVNHTDGEYNDDADPGIVVRHIASLTTVDAQVSMSPRVSETTWLHKVVVSVGADDLLDRRPPFADGQNWGGFDARNYPPIGRTVYARLSKYFGGTAE
jgi:iron complex outermembrane receptor protein